MAFSIETNTTVVNFVTKVMMSTCNQCKVQKAKEIKGRTNLTASAKGTACLAKKGTVVTSYLDKLQADILRIIEINESFQFLEQRMVRCMQTGVKR